MTGNSKWRLSFWPVLAFAVLLPVLVSLGIWQVDRGIEKRELHAQFAAVKASIDVTGSPLDAVDDLPTYAEISLRGRYLDDSTFLLDNLSHAGRPGHHVLTPFRPDGADYVVIVDRGWRPGIASSSAIEPVPPSDAANVRGKLAPFPRPGLTLEGKPEAEGPWPRVVQFPDAAELSRQLGVPVAQRRVLLDESAPEGFVRDWQAPGMPPARHYAYAFQWFALAAALVAIFFVTARPRRSSGDKT